MERIGPLPVNAYSWEDWDIDVRLMQAGETVVFVPAARLLTDRPTTVREYWQNNVRCQRAHLAGLWYHREALRSRPAWGFSEIFFYLVSFGVILALVAAIVLAILLPEYRRVIVQLIALGMLWIGGRRVALAAEIAVFKGDLSWSWRGWSVLALLPLQFQQRWSPPWLSKPAAL